MKSNIHISKIIKIFNSTTDFRIAHQNSKSILEDIARDSNFLFEVVKHNLSNPNFLKQNRHYSTLAMQVYEDENVNIVINIFPTLPNLDTKTSFQSIHHHGGLILSTAAIFGSSYDAITFKKNFVIDKNSFETKMEIAKQFHHHPLEVDFVDSFTPHVVFYPKDISATCAIWSKETKNEISTASNLKKYAFINKFKKSIRKIIEFLGIEKLVGIAKVEFYDFYPEKNKIIALKNRIHYNGMAGSVDNFVQNIFHFIQQIGFNDAAFLKTIYQKNTTSEFTKKIIQQFINKEEIKAEFVDAYLNIPKVNLQYSDIINAIENPK